MERRPIVIVGSGPGGASSALSIQQRDPVLAADTLILEKARHPRPKVCAGGVIPAALRSLRGLGVDLSVPHVTVHRAYVTTPAAAVSHDEHNLCFVVRRAEFDQSLAVACTARGLALRENEPVVDLRRDGNGIRLETPRGSYHTRLVIGADGAGSLVRRRLVDSGRDQFARAVMCDVPMRESQWEGFAAQRYDFDFRERVNGLRGYRWVFPCLIDGEPHANVGAYTLTPNGTALDRSLTEYVDGMTAHETRRYAFPVHWYRRGTRIAAANVLLVGDAAGVDPLMGEGISLALEYGTFAAEAAVRAWRTGDFSGVEYARTIETSWLGKKLRRLHLAARLFYGPAWRLWFSLPERSTRIRAMGLRWYNGVDDWDRRSGWQALATLVTGR